MNVMYKNCLSRAQKTAIIIYVNSKYRTCLFSTFRKFIFKLTPHKFVSVKRRVVEICNFLKMSLVVL